MADFDPGKLSGWYTAFAPALCLYAKQWAGSNAQDMVQEAFVQLMAQRREPVNVKAWLYRTVRNAAISQLRSRQSRDRREKFVGASREQWFMNRADDLIDAATAQEALAILASDDREIVVLRIWSQLNFAEIAELTRLPLSSVYDRYKTAVATLRRKMESTHARAKPIE